MQNSGKNKLIKSIRPKSKSNMRGAGFIYRNRKYIIHTTLEFAESSFYTFNGKQFIVISLLIIFTGIIYIFYPFYEILFFITILSFLYFIDTLFNLYLILRSLNKPVEISFSKQELENLKDRELPIYTILCPLYKEARIVPQFLRAISKLEWPKKKLDVIILLEQDDPETISAVKRMNLPAYCRIEIVPSSLPKTKPKACNYGLSLAGGEYLVIYDAEDIPDPLQLKKAYLGFTTLPSNIRCLQAKLNYYNPTQNLLTKLFTSEYSLWFDLTLTGLQSLNSVLPLGGTSNHFRITDLRELQGWDPFNVTEDADLGIRLFKKGYKTAIMDSTTLEEANSSVGNWFRQRSRWIKGYMQTYLVHTRNTGKFLKENGLKHTLIFHMTMGGKILFLFINPVMWAITISYFVFYESTSLIIEMIFYPPVSYFAVVSWIFGNFLFIYYYMIACAKRQQWYLIKYIFMIPIYWAMMSWAAAIALYQLFVKPHYWEKTVHGLHLNKKTHVARLPKKQSISIFRPAAVGNKAVSSI